MLLAEWGEVWAQAAAKQTHAGSEASSPVSGDLERIPAGLTGQLMDCQSLNSANQSHPTRTVNAVQRRFKKAVDAGPVAAAASAAGEYAQALSVELERKVALFQDDATFILEVREGRSPAPGMDPAAELRTLKTRFQAFKADFKARLRAHVKRPENTGLCMHHDVLAVRISSRFLWTLFAGGRATESCGVQIRLGAASEILRRLEHEERRVGRETHPHP